MIEACRQVRFALSSASIFSRTDKITDSERFYTSLFDMLDDPREKKDVDALLGWWNRYAPCLQCLHHYKLEYPLGKSSHIYPLKL
jgi:hypothetical protein